MPKQLACPKCRGFMHVHTNYQECVFRCLNCGLYVDVIYKDGIPDVKSNHIIQRREDD